MHSMINPDWVGGGGTVDVGASVGTLVGGTTRNGVGVGAGATVWVGAGATVWVGAGAGAVGSAVASSPCPAPPAGSGVGPNFPSITTSKGRRVGVTPGTGTAVDRVVPDTRVGVTVVDDDRCPGCGATNPAVPDGAAPPKTMVRAGSEPEVAQPMANAISDRIANATGCPRLALTWLVLKQLLQRFGPLADAAHGSTRN